MSDEIIIDQIGDDNIIRVQKSKDYFTASNKPFQDSSLSWETRGLLAYLLSKPNHWQTRMGDLIKQGPAGQYKVKRMLAEARLHGYVARVRVRDEVKKSFYWITYVYETVEQNPFFELREAGFIKASARLSRSGSEEKASARFPTSGKPTSGKPTSGKPRGILNTEGENTERENIDSEITHLLGDPPAGVVETTPSKDEDDYTNSLSLELQRELINLGVYKPIWKEIIPLLADGWSEADMVALIDWMNEKNPSFAASGFVTRLREGTRAPSKYYDFVSRDMAGRWYPGREAREENDFPEVETEPEDLYRPTGDPVPEGAIHSWQAVCDRLALEMPPAAFDTWVQGTRVVGYDPEGRLWVAARNSFARQWLETRMTEVICRFLPGVEVSFVVMEEQ